LENLSEDEIVIASAVRQSGKRKLSLRAKRGNPIKIKGAEPLFYGGKK